MVSCTYCTVSRYRTACCIMMRLISDICLLQTSGSWLWAWFNMRTNLFLFWMGKLGKADCLLLEEKSTFLTILSFFASFFFIFLDRTVESAVWNTEMMFCLLGWAHVYLSTAKQGDNALGSVRPSVHPFVWVYPGHIICICRLSTYGCVRSPALPVQCVCLCVCD